MTVVTFLSNQTSNLSKISDKKYKTSMGTIVSYIESPSILKIIGQKVKKDIINKFRPTLEHKYYAITRFKYDSSFDRNKANKYSLPEFSIMALQILVTIFRCDSIFTPMFQDFWIKYPPIVFKLLVILMVAISIGWIFSHWIEMNFKRHFLLIIFTLMLSLSIGIISALYVTYDFGIIIGLVTCACLIQLHWFSCVWNINFILLGLYTATVEFNCIMLEVYFSILYPNLSIFHTCIIHVSLLFSLIWLSLITCLFKAFGESHLLSFITVSTNFINLTSKTYFLTFFYLD